MDFFLQRKIEANNWLIKARWYYILGFGFLGVVAKCIGPYDLPFLITGLMVASAFVVNIFLKLAVDTAKQYPSKKRLLFISGLQVGYELLMFSFIFYVAGGLESVTAIFFVLPIFSSALLFGADGSTIVSLLAGVFLSAVVNFEYSDILPHFYRYGVDTSEYSNPAIALVQVISYFIFYIIAGVFSGFFARLIMKREEQLQDKTEQIKKEIAKTKEVKDKSIAIISNLSDPIIVLDENHKFYLFNPAAEEVLGVGIPDLGMKVLCKDDVCRNKFDLSGFKKLIKKQYASKKLPEDRVHDLEVEEMTIQHNSEEKVYKVITSKVTGDHNEYYGMMKIFYDLTRENRIDKMKSEFISVAAHQLRTPLSAIKWTIDLILKSKPKKLPKDQYSLLEKTYKSNERMIRLVDDLLNVSRIEEGRFGFKFKKNNFSGVIESVLDMIEPKAKKHKVDLDIKIPKNLPIVEIDKDRIEMVLQNLLDNAIKYTPQKGKVTLSVKKEKNKIAVSVKDSGVGIPEKEQSKLFSKFFRAENVIRMETEGTGLGLFIAKNIIEKHGGKITFESREGKGSEFKFYIPIK